MTTQAKPLRVYSDVVSAGLIQPAKRAYTKRDVDRLIVDSLFTGKRTLSLSEAKFICRCSAAYHNTSFSPYCRSNDLDAILA